MHRVPQFGSLVKYGVPKNGVWRIDEAVGFCLAWNPGGGGMITTAANNNGKNIDGCRCDDSRWKYKGCTDTAGEWIDVD